MAARKSQTLTPRQKMAVKNRMQGMTKKDALLKAGYSATTAQASTNVFRRMDPALRDAFAKAGLTIEHISKTIYELTEDDQGSVKAAGVKLWKDLTGTEPPKQHEHDISGHLSIEQIRKEQSRLAGSLEWLE